MAHHHVRRAAWEALSTQQRREAQLAFLRHAASQGVACVHECAGPDISGADDLTSLLELSGQGGLPEVIGYWGELGALEQARQLGVRGLAGDLSVDGAIGSRTAALREPYADDPTTAGALYLDAQQIAEHLVACTKAGLQGRLPRHRGRRGGRGLRGLGRPPKSWAPALASMRHRWNT